MATAAVLAPHDVSTTLNYVSSAQPKDEPTYTYTYDPPEGTPRTNVLREAFHAVIHDVRGREHEFTLDTAGFQFVKHISAEKEFADDERIKDVYYKEVEELLKRETGAKRVVVFDHTLRLRPELQVNTPGRIIRGPAVRLLLV